MRPSKWLVFIRPSLAGFDRPLTPGNEPGLFVVGCDRLEHDVAVKVVNELCTFGTEKQIESSENNGKPQAVHVSIIQLAK